MYKLELRTIEKNILKDQICHYWDCPCEVRCDACLLNNFEDCFIILKQIREKKGE